MSSIDNKNKEVTVYLDLLTVRTRRTGLQFMQMRSASKQRSVAPEADQHKSTFWAVEIGHQK